MTVQEMLTFYATLQLPDSNTKHQRQERIAEVLAAMGLSHTVDTLVGHPGRFLTDTGTGCGTQGVADWTRLRCWRLCEAVITTALDTIDCPNLSTRLNITSALCRSSINARPGPAASSALLECWQVQSRFQDVSHVQLKELAMSRC
jgi:hypothetical protein